MENGKELDSIQWLLFKHPIYNWLVEDDMHVLVVGDGLFAQKFVDLCLQSGQMLNHNLIITWFVDEAMTEKQYLDARPALSDFVNINGSLDDYGKESYATLNIKLKNADFNFDFSSTIEHYIFFATESSEYNERTAKIFEKSIGSKCLIAYKNLDTIEVISENDYGTKESTELLIADNRLCLDGEILRLAYNTHMVWEGSGNISLDSANKRFDNKYNRDASIAFAISIPYKLKSIGVEDADFRDAADSFYKKMQEHKASSGNGVVYQMAYLEHRRWVIDMLTKGFVPLDESEYDDFIKNGSIKSSKKHPCIVHSSMDASLNNWNHDEWNSTDNFNTLDELDSMSINIHRHMQKFAKTFAGKRIFGIPEFRRLSNYLKQFSKDKQRIPKLIAPDYNRYVFCLTNILDNSYLYSSNLDKYEDALVETVTGLEGIDVEIVKREIINTRKCLFPLIEFNLYRNYKSYDINLINKMPYILSNNNDMHILTVLGIADENGAFNSNSFTNVASATALHATTITYLYYYDARTDWKMLLSKIKGIDNYFKYRGCHCSINIVVFYGDNMLKPMGDLHEEFKKIKGKIISEYTILDCKNADGVLKDALKWIDTYKTEIDYYDGANRLFENAFLNSKFTSSISEKIPCFQFDSYNKKFIECLNASELKYVDITSFIQVEDMFALINANNKRLTYLDCANVYRDFWDIYIGKDLEKESDISYPVCWTYLTKAFDDDDVEKISPSKYYLPAIFKTKNTSLDDKQKKEICIIENMYRAMCDKGLISDLKFDYTKEIPSAEFKTASKGVADMLSKAGNVLEAFVYFEASNTGWFDDVQTSYEFLWENNTAKNEFDCVLTKDYRSIIVECKSCDKFDADYYYQLDSLANHFGIGFKKVLIVVTDKDEVIKYVSRGKRTNIITISNKNADDMSDIEDIGNKLIEIMKGELNQGEELYV